MDRSYRDAQAPAGYDSSKPNSQRAQLEALYSDMEPHSLYPLWEVLAALVTPVPQSAARATKWGYGQAREFLMRAGDLITAEEAERRVLILENPGLPGSSSATTSLYTGLQMILPGEVAPCHRHTQSALRFVMEGEGAYTAVDGEKAVMSRFDLVLTPNWNWHDHGNHTSRPMIWLDGLDIPTIRHFDASFAEKLPEAKHPDTQPAGDSLMRYGGNMRPMRGSSDDKRSGRQPLFHYPYKQWRENLRALATTGAPDPYLGHALEFLNPADGGPVMPTISAHVRHLPAGFETKPRRSSDGAIFVCVEGEGAARVGDEDFSLAEGDILVVPSWRSLIFKAETGLTLFGYSDRAAQEKLSIYREVRQ